jgi:chromosomal replication initiation ATPase DnaA
LDFQIISNSFEEIVYKFDSISTDNNGLVLHIKNEDVLTKISSLSNDNKIEISIECKQADNQPYKLLNLGKIDDILDNKIIIRLTHPSYLDYIFNFRNEFIIKIPSYPGALIKQRSALKDFGINKIVNSELKTQLISPSIVKNKIDSSWVNVIEKGIDWQNSQLTLNQKDTINKVLLEKNISLIQGPPGTGKTTIIKEIAYQQLKHKPSEKILIVSQQNVAVDNALSRIYTENIDWFEKGKFSFVRIAPNENKVSPELRKFTIENWFAEYKDKTQKSYSKILYENPNCSFSIFSILPI